MSAEILDGRVLAARRLAELGNELQTLKLMTGRSPCFVNLVCGEDPGAASYGKSQKKSAQALGIDYRFTYLARTVSRAELFDAIKMLNEDHQVHGIMLHKPVPDSIDFQEAVNHIAPDKDLEGLNVVNLGALFLGKFAIVPCTAAAVMELLALSGLDLKGKRAVVVGRSEIVGKPLIHLLLARDATVTVCHSATSRAGRLQEELSGADVVVAALGRAEFIRGEWLKHGAVVVDVGINQVGGRLTGDCHFESCALKASWITPVPGGVGPVTAVCLMQNGIEAFRRQVR